ncbi:MAG: S8 family serine peptidase, partial [Saprospiraceae bacterium]|nr:S8 family serine peptidase [Saprospiraceae bacterium]
MQAMTNSLKHIVLILILCHTTSANAQRISKFWISFKDKQDSPYCLCRPEEFLSFRALERRYKAGIPLDESDLPVNPAYLEALKQAGAVVHNSSKWLNAAAVMADSVTARKLETLPFVQEISYLGPHLKYRNLPNRPEKKRAPLTKNPAIQGRDVPYWGYAGQQNQMLGIPLLHMAGHRGKDIWVAVLDGGFSNADTIPMFDSTALQGRLFQGWDFVERDAAVYESAQHGTSVLSVMASNIPYYFVGTAPDATYFLLKTEDTGGEFPIEEANWVAAAEWADSVGIDILNASLGYTVFNDRSLGHFKHELDGQTSIGARGARYAAAKGMIVCNSAGNEGDGEWRTIGVPADAFDIVAVGAVDASGARASFSSMGPTADHRIKPDLVAPGDQIVVAGNVGISLGLSSGTSLASPMLAGAIAALWSAYPEKPASEIMEAVYASADQRFAPDNERGFGLPDMTEAWIRLGEMENGNGGIFSYEPESGAMTFYWINRGFRPVGQAEIRDILGRKVADLPIDFVNTTVAQLQISGFQGVPSGHYQILLKNEDEVMKLGGATFGG